ncbi:DNA-binding CsgD family transcriptional regulator [Bradyrhizobium diazoefficiens]|uniref:helix-turn-helix transcriptional regulator n=1 Tax=Bradyrhizobium TaxID=374 RepID=UPI003182FDE2
MTVAALTSKQRQVCELVAEGLSNKEIGVRLGIGHRTVEFHRAQVYRRLGVRNAVELVRKLLEGKAA